MALLQKRPIILGSLLIVATPYLNLDMGVDASSKENNLIYFPDWMSHVSRKSVTSHVNESFHKEMGHIKYGWVVSTPMVRRRTQ